MTKTFKLNGIDCANCAAKMEKKIGKIDGVKSCTITFMTSKITIEADDDKFDSVIAEAKAVIAKNEPDWEFIA